MQQIKVDSSIGSELSSALDPVQVCDQEGRLLGYFNPIVDRSLYSTVEPPSSEEELLRRAAAGGGRPLMEIIADLEKGT